MRPIPLGGLSRLSERCGAKSLGGSTLVFLFFLDKGEVHFLENQFQSWETLLTPIMRQLKNGRHARLPQGHEGVQKYDQLYWHTFCVLVYG